jgi:nucleoside-diphosphate-sugar epimerase
MRIAVTGGTGFLGRFIINHLLGEGHTIRAWHRSGSDQGGFVNGGQAIEWLGGRLNDPDATRQLVAGSDAVVHAALERHSDNLETHQTNIMGSLRLMEESHQADCERFVFISTCAIHEVILEDRPLDEAHPLWPRGHYGAMKAAIEKFVHSYGLGDGWPICALRPTGIYGPVRPIKKSRWFGLVRDIVAGKDIDESAGGKEVHAADVARAVSILLNSKPENIRGQSFNCYDQYISLEQVARIAKEITGSASQIPSRNPGPKNQIDTTKIENLGMAFGGETLLREYVGELVVASNS